MNVRNPSFGKGQFLAFIITGALIALLLTLVKLYVEQQPWGYRAELLTYEFLQNWVPPYDKSPMSVVVLDIGRLPGGKGDEVTDRKLLLDLVRTVIDQNPQAVAVDIDFSPVNGVWRSPLDPKFFDFCLEQRRKHPSIPVFVGIYETSLVRPDAWLGVPKYKELAVGIGLPPEETKKIPLWIGSENWPDRLPSLSAALADVRGRAHADLPRWLEVAIDSPSEGKQSEPDPWLYAPGLVNYTRLDELKHQTVEYIPTKANHEPVLPALSRRETLSNRLVILGDVTEATDTFPVPGHEGQFPGVYLHASAVHTLTTHPIFELKRTAQYFLEIVITSLLILSAAFIRHRHRNDPEFSHRSQMYLTIASIVLLFAGVIVLVRYYNVFWFDVHLAIIALFLHVKLERAADIFRRLARLLKQAHILSRE